jgi:hypothetical protein
LRHPNPWKYVGYYALVRSIEQPVPEGPHHDGALEAVTILDCAQLQLKGEGIALASCNPSADLPDIVKGWKKMIEAAKVDRDTHAKTLAVILRDLVRSNEADRIYVLRGLLRSDRFRDTGKEMPALATHITSAECPVSTALTDADKSAIAEAAKTAVASSKSP